MPARSSSILVTASSAAHHATMSQHPLVRRVRHEPRYRMLEVLEVHELTPRMRRVVLGGPELADFVSLGATDHVKLFFPAPGQDVPVLPVLDEQGRGVPPAGGVLVRRDFTPRSYDPERGHLAIDFLLHGHGPASTWAASAAPGRLLGVGGPRGSRIVSPELDWYLLGGDETALPALGRWLEHLPAAARVIALAEVGDASDEFDIADGAAGRVTWLHRGAAQAGTTSLLADAVRSLDLPAGEGFAWFGAEASSLREVRRHLREDRGMELSRVDVSGYWKRGVAEHDHHAAVEPEPGVAV